MDSESMDPESIRRWVAGRQLAARREKQELRERGPNPQESIARALDLIRLTEDLYGWPIPEDPVSQREDREMYETWARLRAGWPSR